MDSLKTCIRISRMMSDEFDDDDLFFFEQPDDDDLIC